MIVRRLKIATATTVAAAAVVAVVAAVAALAGGIAFFSSGADPAAALKEIAIDVPAAARVDWQPDAPGLPRAMEDATRTAITAAYLAAWDHRTEGGDADYLAGPAAAGVPPDPEDAVREADLAHDLELAFYSADGQLVAFGDTVSITRHVALAGGPWSTAVTERYTVVMILVDGNWRLRHWVRDSR